MRRLLATTLGVLASALILAPTAAHADSGQVLVDLPGDGQSWVHDSSAALLDMSRMAPGSVLSTVIGVRNDSSNTAALALAALDIRDDDNGCNHPERQVDNGCGAGQGELGHQMALRIYVDPTHTGTFASSPTWSGSVYDLASAAELAEHVPAGGELDVKLEAELPMTSGNETQTDRLGFGVRVSLESDAGGSSTVVKGVKNIRGGGLLPFTGAEIRGVIQLGFGLLLLGVLASWSARRRPVATPGPRAS